MTSLDAPPTEAEADRPQGPVASFLGTYWFGVTLWKRIFLGMALGVGAGLILGEQAEQIRWIGDLFIRLIRMLVTPLVFATIVAGVVSMGDIRRLGGIGVKTLFLYFVTTLIGAALGLGLGALARPGVGVVLGQPTDAPAVAAPLSLTDQFLASLEVRQTAWRHRAARLAVVFERARQRGELRAGVEHTTALELLFAPINMRALYTGEPVDHAYCRTVADLVFNAVAS